MSQYQQDIDNFATLKAASKARGKVLIQSMLHE